MEYRILIVAQDLTARRRYTDLLSHAQPTPGASYKVLALSSIAAARLQATRQHFELILIAADPDEAALLLAATIFDLYKGTVRTLLLMNGPVSIQQSQKAQASGTRLLARNADDEQITRSVATLLGLRRTGMLSAPEPPVAPARTASTTADMQMIVEMLRREARAQFAIFVDSIGHVITKNGDDRHVDVPAFSSLIASSFINSVELGHVLRDTETVHVSIHEGRYYDVYAANVGHDHLIALLFEKQIAAPRLGFVWLLMKRAAQQLARMQANQIDDTKLLDPQITSSLNSEFDRLFGNELLMAPLPTRR